jgi:hypothetical protein
MMSRLLNPMHAQVLTPGLILPSMVFYFLNGRYVFARIILG